MYEINFVLINTESRKFSHTLSYYCNKVQKYKPKYLPFENSLNHKVINSRTPDKQTPR